MTGGAIFTVLAAFLARPEQAVRVISFGLLFGFIATAAIVLVVVWWRKRHRTSGWH